jgi:hypothetical protein
VRAVVFWCIAAALVTTVDRAVAAPAACLIVKVLTIVAVAFAYVRFAARETTLDAAVLVGAGWLLLVIATEIAVAAHLHHAFSPLLGSAARPAPRYVLLAAWVAAPSLFVTRR